MAAFQMWDFPQLPQEALEIINNSDKELVIVGVIGKSAEPDCNKMVALNVLDRQPCLVEHTPQEGHIQFYYNEESSMLLLHFETTYDAGCVQSMLKKDLADGKYSQFLLFHQKLKNRFGRMILFATHVCHILVFVELSVTFDASLLSLFTSLKIIRDKHVIKFLPKMLKNTSAGTVLGKSCRLCSPRILFLFENYPDGYEKTNESISKLEFEVEDNIYKMLRNEFVITNNSAASLFSIPGNKRFVYYNTDENLREDPLLKSIDILNIFLEKSNFNDDDEGELNELRPYKGFGISLTNSHNYNKPSSADESPVKQRNFMTLLKDHINEAIKCGFDDSMTKYKGKSHFVLMPLSLWYENFLLMYKIFILNPDDVALETTDHDYKSYLESFDKLMNVDNEFFLSSCEIGLKKAIAIYNNPAISHYSTAVHKKMVDDAIISYRKYARGPETAINEMKLREVCERIWENGKQQCEVLSLRGLPCIMAKHVVRNAAEHSSGVVFISTCNCGKTQGRREDPYTLRRANYEFYEYMANNCNLCAKVRKINFAVFEPSINDFRAAEFEIAFPKLSLSDQFKNEVPLNNMEDASDLDDDHSQPLTASQGSHDNLSLDSLDNIKRHSDINSSDESLNEFVLHVKDKDHQEEAEKEPTIYRQPSTTEYLPGMSHTESPLGLLPQFPSWSLVCVGVSSIYSHSTGLMEHFQAGFLPGANYLLPWDVHVRLENPNWTAAYEKTRYRKMGEVFILKIFVGFEYECPRGHRFMMSSPDKILRGGSGILRDSGSKVVYNNMPLYFPCPCRSSKLYVAQLMRIHVVTPKAPVNVILDPKVRTGEHNYIFTLGMESPPKLSQSAYWILRLPYIYQADDKPIMPPTDVTAATALNSGCLLAGMFGVTETEVDE